MKFRVECWFIFLHSCEGGGALLKNIKKITAIGVTVVNNVGTTYGGGMAIETCEEVMLHLMHSLLVITLVYKRILLKFWPCFLSGCTLHWKYATFV